jgi:hypothetical protein
LILHRFEEAPPLLSSIFMLHFTHCQFLFFIQVELWVPKDCNVGFVRWLLRFSIYLDK